MNSVVEVDANNSFFLQEIIILQSFDLETRVFSQTVTFLLVLYVGRRQTLNSLVKRKSSLGMHVTANGFRGHIHVHVHVHVCDR